MSDKEQKKPTMAEALGARAEEAPPEQTHDEIVVQALAEASAEKGVLAQGPPQDVSPQKKSLEPMPTTPIQQETGGMQVVPDAIPPLMKSNLKTTTNSPPKTETPIIPVSSIDRLHVAENSTPESLEPLTEEKINKMADDFLDKYSHLQNSGVDMIAITPPIADPHLRRLVEYIHSEEYSIAWTQLHITSISSFPRVLPTPTLWDIPSSIDIARLVYELVMQPGFVENTWPYIRLLMGSSRDNTQWSATVLTSVALFEAVKCLPFIIKKGLDENS